MKLLLLIDADDTLWENNVYFERVIEKFIAYVQHPHYTPLEVRRVLDDIERANTRVHGYGSAAFSRNLQEAYRRLACEPVTDTQLEYVRSLAAIIVQQELEIIEGVPETLEYLAPRHRLVLLTKGNDEEQRAKIARSGLSGYFSDAIIVHEKHRETYLQLTAELGGEAAHTWMIGNSPRSDINPALAAGLNAVWVPHANTWTLEQEELVHGPGKLAVVSRFAGLRDIF